LGHARDHQLRYRATSGGALTALLKTAFETGQIDAAIVTGPDPTKPTDTRPFAVFSYEEVMQKSGAARYAPSPVNQCLRETKSAKKIALVGLPCHLESLRKAEQLREQIRPKIALRLGLFCSHNLSMLATEFVLRGFRLRPEEIHGLKYRGDGWPGGLQIDTADGRKYRLPNQNSIWTRMFMAFAFAAPYCLLCNDHTSELADVSFGDAWLPEVLKTDMKGQSIIITRTHVGEHLVMESAGQGHMEVSSLPERKVVESQRWPLYFKKRLIHISRERLEKKRFDIGEYTEPSASFSAIEHWLVRRARLNSMATCHRHMPLILSCLPPRLIEAHCQRYSHKLSHASAIWLRGMEP